MLQKTFAILVALAACATFAAGYRISEKDKNKHLDDDSNESSDTLVLAHVLFRHGDRTPDVSTIYPTDPYANETYAPYGKGQLTLQGKERAYRLGELLRERYDNFLGPIYLPDLVEARSSSYPRTRATLELVLASLFVPTEEYKIRDNLLWQPIPFEFTPRETDNLIATFISCEKVFDEVEEVQKAPKARKEFRKNKRMYDYLSEKSGWDVNSTTRASFIQNTLQTESEWGLQLPEWVEKVWPGPLKRAAGEFWRFYGSTPKLRSMAIGNLLGKMINDTIMHITNDLPQARKMFLYAGHDFNVVPFVAALGNPVSETPYTAHVILEVHNVDDEYYIKAFYNDYSEPEPKLLRVKDCPELCPFEQFQDLMKENIPAPNKWCK